MEALTPTLYFVPWSEQLRVAPTIVLTDEQHSELTRLARSKRTSVRLAQRARIVLLVAQGLQNKQVAEQLGIGRVQVARWRERYLECGLQGIERDLPRGAPPVKVDAAKLVELTTQTTPEAATHWSTRKMGAVLGVSASTVMRHLAGARAEAAYGAGFKVSRDPRSSSRSSKTSGLVPVPARACAGAVLRREEPGAGAGSHPAGIAAEEGARADDDPRLHAPRHHDALCRAQCADGKVIGQCHPRHRTHAEWLKFLRNIDRQTPRDRPLHLICR